MKHVVMFSGGAASWATAKRVAERHGTDDLTLLFADTNTEDADLYRFLHQAALNVGGELVILENGGRDIWDVFYGWGTKGFLGNSRVAHCSFELKQRPSNEWLEKNCDVESTISYVGIGYHEAHRFERIKELRAPWRYEAPLCEPPFLTKQDIFDWMREEGIEPPRLYGLGFAHNNCGGGCVKAGHAHWEHLLRTLPEVFAEWERKEEEFRQWQSSNVSILTTSAGGTKTPLTLREFRERCEARTWDVINLFENEAQGCGGSCFFDPELEDAA